MPRSEQEKVVGRKRLNALILILDAALIGYIIFVIVKAIIN